MLFHDLVVTLAAAQPVLPDIIPDSYGVCGSLQLLPSSTYVRARHYPKFRSPAVTPVPRLSVSHYQPILSWVTLVLFCVHACSIHCRLCPNTFGSVSLGRRVLTGNGLSATVDDSGSFCFQVCGVSVMCLELSNSVMMAV